MNNRNSGAWWIFVVLGVVGCGPENTEPRETWQPELTADGAESNPNSGFEIVTDKQGRVVTKQTRNLTAKNSAVLDEIPKPAGTMPGNFAVHDKVQRKLRDQMAAARPSDKLDVVVSVRKETQFSPLPRIDESLPRESPVNVQRLEERRAAFEAMAAPRREALRRWSQRLRAEGGDVLGEYVLGSAVVAKLPARAVEALSADDEIHGLASPEGEQPAADSNSLNDAIDARALVGTDPFVNAGYVGSWGWLGLLDTGVRSSHVMLTVPSPIALESDCYRGGSTCRDSSQPGYSTTDTYGHGTNSAAIIAGTVNLGSSWRGITAQQKIDSWKISTDLGGTDTASVLRAYERAVVWSEWGVVATIQVNQSPGEALSSGANDLYDLGVAVFASNGNFSGLARAPANANKALGIGGYDVVSGTNLSGNVGTSDGRHKPDLRTPSNVETAYPKTTSGAVCDSCMNVYGGTSCAAPVAAGTAALLRDYFINTGLPSGPGYLYAGMIAFGTESPNDTNGSGKTMLAGPSCSRFSVGQVTVANGEVVYVSVTVGAGEFGSNLKAGIWWPTEPGFHRDVDLRIENPSGSVVAFSQGIPSVFERAQVNGTLQNGTWRIRIKGYNIPTGSQTVYYVIHNKIC